MEFSMIKEIIASSARKCGISQYDVYYSESNSVSVDTLKDDIDSFSSNDSIGIYFRCIVNGKIGAAATELLNESELGNVVRRAYENAQYVECEDEAIIYKGAESYKEIQCYKFSFPTSTELKEKALELQRKTYNAEKRVIDGTQCGTSAKSVVIKYFNSYGLELEKKSGALQYYSCPVVSDGENTEDSFDYEMSATFSNVDNVVFNAVKKSVSKLSGELVDSGIYNLVISGKQMAVMLSEFCGAFSAKSVKLGLSMLKDEIYKKVASDCITVIDDPMSSLLIGNSTFDAEGVPTRRKILVENGVLKTFLYDLSMAKHFRVESTGNAVKHGYASPVSISPYFLYIEKGVAKINDLFTVAENGIYITDLKSFSAANAVTGDFSIESAGYLIVNGKIGKFVKSFTIAGNFFELLKNIEMISDNLQLENMGLFSGYAAPDVLVKNMSVAGK